MFAPSCRAFGTSHYQRLDTQIVSCLNKWLRVDGTLYSHCFSVVSRHSMFSRFHMPTPDVSLLSPDIRCFFLVTRRSMFLCFHMPTLDVSMFSQANTRCFFVVTRHSRRPMHLCCRETLDVSVLLLDTRCFFFVARRTPPFLCCHQTLDVTLFSPYTRCFSFFPIHSMFLFLPDTQCFSFVNRHSLFVCCLIAIIINTFCIVLF